MGRDANRHPGRRSPDAYLPLSNPVRWRPDVWSRAESMIATATMGDFAFLPIGSSSTLWDRILTRRDGKRGMDKRGMEWSRKFRSFDSIVA
jgi:hypothetical protein